MRVSLDKVQPGYELPYLIKLMQFDKIAPFSAWLGKNIHTDEECAKDLGLPTVIAQGLMSDMYLIELLTRSFGRDWLEGGTINVKFVKSVFIGDTLSVRAKVIERKSENSGTRVNLSVWCERQGGEQVTVGEASLLVRAETGV